MLSKCEVLDQHVIAFIQTSACRRCDNVRHCSHRFHGDIQAALAVLLALTELLGLLALVVLVTCPDPSATCDLNVVRGAAAHALSHGPRRDRSAST